MAPACSALALPPAPGAGVNTPHSALCLPSPLSPKQQVVKNNRAGETYLLYQCGTPNPQTANTELDLPAAAKVFEIPLVSVAVTDSNAAAFLVRASSCLCWCCC